MLDLKFVRDNADVVRKDLEKRKDTEKLAWVDDILENDQRYREKLQESQDLRAERNVVSKAINDKKKAGENADADMARAKEIPQELNKIETEIEGILEGIQKKLMRLPNIMHESVPYGESNEDNVPVEHFGKKPEFGFKPKDHEELMRKNNLVDLERAAKITGSRFYFLKGDLALLQVALEKYAIDFMTERGYELTIPPEMMNRKAYEGVTDLDDFENVMYNVQPDEFYMIATSEHPLTAMFMNEIIDETELPIKMAGFSHNFRREVGSHDKSDKGIWRVHQFNKVEQVIICKPEDSWELHEELIRNAEDFFTSLGVHFRKVNICTGDLGIVAAKKYDLEAWIPSAEKYKEIVSCSNCTAYQATRLKMRYRTPEGNIPVHTLNSTCVAISRALVVIMEQFQTSEGGITIPEVLRPYMNGKRIIGHI